MDKKGLSFSYGDFNISEDIWSYYSVAKTLPRMLEDFVRMIKAEELFVASLARTCEEIMKTRFFEEHGKSVVVDDLEFFLAGGRLRVRTNVEDEDGAGDDGGGDGAPAQDAAECCSDDLYSLYYALAHNDLKIPSRLVPERFSEWMETPFDVSA